jgi:4-hydroxy-3-methylbut-2-enyl diphosphate reductase
MKFSAPCVAAFLVAASCAIGSSEAAFSPLVKKAALHLPTISQQQTSQPQQQQNGGILVSHMSSTVENEKKTPTKKEERLRMMKTENFFRQGFKEVRGQVEATMSEQFKSPLVDEMKSSNYLLERDGVKVYLAKVRSKA